MNIQDYDLTTEQVSDAIDIWIFGERDRAIMKRRLIDGIVFEKLAEEFDLSVQQTKRIVYKGQERLFRHI